MWVSNEEVSFWNNKVLTERLQFEHVFCKSKKTLFPTCCQHEEPQSETVLAQNLGTLIIKPPGGGGYYEGGGGFYY